MQIACSLFAGSNDKYVMIWDLSGEFDISCQLARSSSASTLAFVS